MISNWFLILNTIWKNNDSTCQTGIITQDVNQYHKIHVYIHNASFGLSKVKANGQKNERSLHTYNCCRSSEQGFELQEYPVVSWAQLVNSN